MHGIKKNETQIDYNYDLSLGASDNKTRSLIHVISASSLSNTRSGENALLPDSYLQNDCSLYAGYIRKLESHKP